uniref:Uncharacterized protein n=1 Tax=Anguilla anguilla TaxID=7936 RepID=A0A0E9TEG6_ANGAN
MDGSLDFLVFLKKCQISENIGCTMYRPNIFFPFEQGLLIVLVRCMSVGETVQKL